MTLQERRVEADGATASPDTRCVIAARAARELVDGQVTNLGAGIPMLVANYIPPGIDVIIQAENGITRRGSGVAARHGGPGPAQRRQPVRHAAARGLLLRHAPPPSR